VIIYTNLHVTISHRFQVITYYWSNLRFRYGVFLINTLVRNERLKFTTMKFGLTKVETSS